MLRLRALLGSALAIMLGAAQPASAQLMWGIVPDESPTEAKYETDTAQVPANVALQCFTLMAVGMDHPDVRVRDETIDRILMKAMQERVDAEIKRTNQSGDAIALAGPLRQQMLQGWELGQYYKMRDQCQIAADAGMAKYLAAPGGQDGINCWAYLANKAPSDPATLFLEYDLRAALDQSKVHYTTRGRLMDSFRDEVKPMLAGPQAAQIDAAFNGCAGKIRQAVRNIAYGVAPADLSSGSRLMRAVSDEMQRGLAGPREQYAALMKLERWPVPAAAWGKAVESVDVGDAVICARERPLRVGRPEGAMAPSDLAMRLLVDAGASTADAASVTGAAMVHPNGFQSVTGLDQACAAWGEAAAKKYGAVFFEGTALNL